MTKTTETYTSHTIEVLTGLDPVRRRPGMYTDTNRPNHLAQEVIDNSVDEAIAGYAKKIEVNYYADGSLEVTDDGRGMPIDKHPEHHLSGVELIMTKLHAGGKFSNKNYQFSGGLHGVGVSVVNALSKRLEVTIKRSGKRYQMIFAGGNKISELKQIGTVNKQDTGTTLRFWPDEKYFDTPQIALSRLKHLLRAKAVLCSGLRICLTDVAKKQTEEWFYEQGLSDYLRGAIHDEEAVPNEPFVGDFIGEKEAVSWALVWLPSGGEALTESYVNLIPTPQGGTHVNGFRVGLLEAIREFCDFRSLLPRGVKLTADDIWETCRYVLSVKVCDPQFVGQTKERLSSKECVTFVSGIVKDALSLWLNQQTEWAKKIVELAIQRAQHRLRSAKKITRKKVTSGPALPGKLADCSGDDRDQSELFLVEGDSAGGSAKQARDKNFQAIMPLRGKILNTWEVDAHQILASQEIHDISVALGVEPNSADLNTLRYGKICILADADSDGAHIATLLCALFVKHFRPLVTAGHVFVAMPPLYRIDLGKEVYYALDEAEKQGLLDRFAAEKKRAKINVQRFKGLGEMNPKQLRETTMDPNTRRLVQLTISDGDGTATLMDMLLAKKRASDRKVWLENKGNLADFEH